ncbi:amidohydrolase [Vagococcus vulneris]|uniref:Peptidase M20 domain-containing protein 2 n=1 Tax=Vagococcus vulneris TaxID=1977869 RepID=A0A429ZZE2_9ENTE|nr:amidohydrolase [Vagococcus vulneris]RST99363.1 amidohydrolase [Vagococcus vulneris]
MTQTLFQHYLSKLKNCQDTAYSFNKDLAHHPELSGQEYQSLKNILTILSNKSISYQTNIEDVETSFLANITKGSAQDPKIGILMEYDALPDIGHGCGHSASGSISLLTALAFWEMKDDLNATIDLIGTPNEEVFGEKITMSCNGLFDSYDFVIMIHMNPKETWASCHFLALREIRVTYIGKPAHAAAAPWLGVNALNGAILTTNALDMLRQQLSMDTRLAYIIKNGGIAPNVIPDKTELIINIRNKQRDDLQKTYQQVVNCIKGASLATGTTYQIEDTGPAYDDMKINKAGVEQLKLVMDELNLPYTEEPTGVAVASSDIGNISYICPAFHPMLAISDDDISLHTQEVADLMKNDSINSVIFNGGRLMGAFIIRMIEHPEILEKIKVEFSNDKN